MNKLLLVLLFFIFGCSVNGLTKYENVVNLPTEVCEELHMKEEVKMIEYKGKLYILSENGKIVSYHLYTKSLQTFFVFMVICIIFLFLYNFRKTVKI